MPQMMPAGADSLPAVRPPPRRVLEGLLFFPRGGSAHVVRSLSRALPSRGWQVTVLSGSRAGHGDARRFFSGLDVRTVDFDAAAASADPLAHDPPFHPSYEDRPDSPDRVFAALDDAAYELQVTAWSRALAESGAAGADVLHLHHLTPLNEAAERVAGGVPVVGHLHGTELLMLEEIAAGPPAGWDHAAAWVQRMRRWARRCARLVLLSESQRERAVRLLAIDPDRCMVLPNGFDPRAFHPRAVDRAAHWRHHLVDAPRGWRPGAEEGSVAYAAQDLAPLTGGDPVLLYVGRFTAVKRVGLLVRAFARARAGGMRAALVLIGGHPGEWEGEHPFDAVAATRAAPVFLAGWHAHDELPTFLAASDALVLPSVREQFGQVLVEAMACERPVVAVDAFGPAEIVQDGVTGWLVEPDDEAGLARVLAAVAGDEHERARRGRAALAVARERYAWPAITGRLAADFDELASARVEA
jgi:glycosyltransferase involved in cell wall biosynthesis